MPPFLLILWCERKPMKKYLPLLLFFFVSACKKNSEENKIDLVVLAMTDGQWAVTNFTQNGTNITSDFTGYKFKYYSNKTVDAIKNGTVEKTGNWDGNATTNTTSASFTGVVQPLSLINGSWHIDRNSWTYVEATQINGTETKTMRLDKQ
jgi:hypothetical protein